MSKIYISDTYFDHPIMNASGCLSTTEDELIELSNSQSSAIVTTSATNSYSYGNVKPRYYDNDILSFDSNGLGNEGFINYNLWAKKLVNKKPFILSISGGDPGEYLQVMSDLIMCRTWKYPCNADFIELNLSCSTKYPLTQIGYDFMETNKILRRIFEMNEINQPIGVKLPAYLDRKHIEDMSEVLDQYPLSFITCINGLGNGLILNENYEPILLPKEGYGAIAGPYIKPFGLSNVKKFHELLPDIPIIGCGGISTGRDVCEYLRCGAKLVQVGTQLVKEGTSVFDRIYKEYLIEKKKYEY